MHRRLGREHFEKSDRANLCCVSLGAVKPKRIKYKKTALQQVQSCRSCSGITARFPLRTPRDIIATMIDHISFAVSDLSAALDFYDTALAPLGAVRVMQDPPDVPPLAVGYGTPNTPFFWLHADTPAAGSLHVAFTAPDRAAVDAFHAAALAAGGRDNGAPGLRPHYHLSYYAAFVLDLNGNNIEAVTHEA